MREKKKFEFLEHTADAYVAAYGKNLEEAFENAALATISVMTDTKKVEPKLLECVEVEAQDEHSLLYNWIEEVLILFDPEGLLFSRFKLSPIEKKSCFSIEGRDVGGALQSKKTSSKGGS